jgi:hypothetical protein
MLPILALDSVNGDRIAAMKLPAIQKADCAAALNYISKADEPPAARINQKGNG